MQFRRQVIVGRYIVDFMAPAVGLVIEVDGEACHAERVVADARRDEALSRAGYLVLRLPASLVERRPLEAVRLVRETLLGAG